MRAYKNRKERGDAGERCAKILGSRRGESLMESIISLLVLSVLLLSVSVMMSTALRVVGDTAQNAKERQEQVVNPLLLSEYESYETAALRLTLSGLPSVSHEVHVDTGSGLTAFRPAG